MVLINGFHDNKCDISPMIIVKYGMSLILLSTVPMTVLVKCHHDKKVSTVSITVLVKYLYDSCLVSL